MNKITKILMLSIGLSGTASYANYDVMTNSIIVQSTPLGEKVTCVSKNRSALIADAALAAAASYNHKDLVNLKSAAIRDQDNYTHRETMIKKGHEIVTFSATVKRNKLLSNWLVGNNMAHGQLPAGSVSYSTDAKGKAKITVAFHGTECNRDLATDANAVKKSDKTLSKTGYIHGGFYNRYMESREAMFDVIQGLLDIHGKAAKDVNFVVTGHSLGGALATLAAVDLKRNFSSSSKLDLVTFGSPRVFNAAGAAEAERVLEGRALRLWREKNPISAVSLGTPLPLGIATGYKHVGTSIKVVGAVKDENGNSKGLMANHDMANYHADATNQKSVKSDLNHKGYKTLMSNTISNALGSVKSGFVNIAKTIGSKLSRLNPFNW